MAAKLEVELLGGVSIRVDGQPVTGFKSRKTEAIFVYLVCQQRPFARESLAYIFWDESEASQAMANLRKTLNDLRQQLGDFVSISRQTVAFHGGCDYSLDVETFEQLLEIRDWRQETKKDQSPISNLQSAVSLYKGDFLQGFYLRDSLQFDEWASLRREQVRLSAMSALQNLVTHEFHYQQYDEGLRHATRWLSLDPLNEAAHRMVMRLQARAGRRNGALAHFAKCKQILEEELGVEPTVETETVFQRIRFAPERPFHFPLSYTSFIGRDEEQAQISQLLDDPTCRLLTLKGQGGVGKTRLALQTAAHCTTDYQDGVAFISVAGVETESALVPTIAEAIDFSLSGAKPPAQQLLQYLQQREMLLVLDNCETLLAPHLRSCLTLVRDIIQKCPRVKILATSRERFNFQAERMLSVSGLAYDDEQASAHGAQAVQLFVARAQQVWPNFGQTADTLAQVSQICELAEGLPLAIELAAVAVAHFPLEQIISSIQENLDFLGQQGDLPERHSSLRAVFAGAWEQLTASEQAAFKKVSVFRGPFALDMAVLVTSTTPSTLLALADKSMLRVTQLGRYEMHQLLRQFAREKLTAVEAKAIHHQHAHYFADFLQQREIEMQGERQMEALTEISRVMEDVRAAWQWGVEQGDETAVSKSLQSLFLLYQMRSWPQEGETAFTKALAVFADDLLLARLRARRGGLRFRLSQYEEAREDLETAVPIFIEHEATDEHAMALTGLGHTFHYLRQREKAMKLYEESLVLHRQTGNQRGEARALNSLGAAYRVQGRYEEAQATLQEGLAIVQQTKDRWVRSMLLNNLGSVSRMLGNYEASIGYYQDSLKLKEEMGDRFGYSTSMGNLGNIYHALEQYDEARACHQEALEICRQTGDQIGVARALNNLGHVAYDLGQYDEAQDWHQQSLALKESINDQYGMVHSFHHLGRTMLALQDLEAAQAYFHQGLQLALEMEAVPLVLDIFVSWAALLVQLDQVDTAVQLLTFAQQHPRSTKRTCDTSVALLQGLGVVGETAVVPTLEELAQTLLAPNL